MATRPEIDYSFQETKGVDVASRVVEGQFPCELMVSPTGTGKTVMQAKVMKKYRGQILQVVPTLEIARGFMDDVCLNLPRTGTEADRKVLESQNVFTVKKLKNRLAAGDFDLSNFKCLQIDEAHHSTDDTHRLVDAYLGRMPRLGWTGTHYRGTAIGTGQLLDFWQGRVSHVLRIPEAIAMGVMTLPTITMWPLVDDELIDVTNGDFQVAKAEAHTKDVLGEVVERCRAFWDAEGQKWDRPTMIAVPGVATAKELGDRFAIADLPACVVTGETKDAERQKVFERLASSSVILIQVAVVTEGVNIPELGRLIDLDPTMSPVKCMQRVGRLCRPKLYSPEWIVCNHNLLRHGYLWEGCIPPAAFIAAKTAWSKDFKPSKRLAIRAVRGDLKTLGRFTPANVPLADGMPCWLYCFSVNEGFQSTQYAVILKPDRPEPILAERKIPLKEDADGRMVKDFTTKPKWRRVKTLPDVKGGISVPCHPISLPMEQWWDRSHKFLGLKSREECQPDAREFQILPILSNLELPKKDRLC